MVILGMIAVTLVALGLLATVQITSKKEFADFCFVAITQGILVAGASVYVNQILVQNKKGERTWKS